MVAAAASAALPPFLSMATPLATASGPPATTAPLVPAAFHSFVTSLGAVAGLGRGSVCARPGPAHRVRSRAWRTRRSVMGRTPLEVGEAGGNGFIVLFKACFTSLLGRVDRICRVGRA